MRAGEFHGAPLVAGSVVGVRAFGVDMLGRLRGVSHDQVWTPGENVADCKIRVVSEGDAKELRGRYRESAYSISASGRPVSSLPAFRIDTDPHDIGSCSCGFYAYYSGSNDYASDERVQAVIEGWGETAIGTRGFRTSKARILALCVQGEIEPEPVAPKKAEPVRWALDHLGLFGAIAAVPGLVAALINNRPVWTLVLSALLVVNVVMQVVGDRQRRKPKRTTSPRGGWLPPTSSQPAPIDVAKLRRNYPDVPIFTNYKQMIAEFPTSRGEEPTPQTDPDFWTRGI